MVLIDQMDNALRRYFKHYNRQYNTKHVYDDEDGNGVLKSWCDENGYDSDMIAEDLEQGTGADILEWIDDFPTRNDDRDEKMKEMLKILKECFENKDAFLYSINLKSKPRIFRPPVQSISHTPIYNDSYTQHNNNSVSTTSYNNLNYKHKSVSGAKYTHYVDDEAQIQKAIALSLQEFNDQTASSGDHHYGVIDTKGQNLDLSLPPMERELSAEDSGLRGITPRRESKPKTWNKYDVDYRPLSQRTPKARDDDRDHDRDHERDVSYLGDDEEEPIPRSHPYSNGRMEEIPEDGIQFNGMNGRGNDSQYGMNRPPTPIPYKSARNQRGNGSRSRSHSHVDSTRIAIATEPMYESAMSSVIRLSTFTLTQCSSELRQNYEAAIQCHDAGEDALHRNELKRALKQFSTVFVHLGSHSNRPINAFCTTDGHANPLRKNKVFDAVDRLRCVAMLGMARVYGAMTEWRKVIGKCSQVLDGDDTIRRALLLRGRAYRELKELENAKSDLEKAQKLPVVDMELEIALDSIRQQLSPLQSDDANVDHKDSNNEDDGHLKFTTFSNDHWPRLPLRDSKLEGWIKGSDDGDNVNVLQVPESMLFPVPSEKGRYKLYTDQEMLDLAVSWLDVDAALKLMKYELFDLNTPPDATSGMTYVHQLSCGELQSGFKYHDNRDKFETILSALCKQDVDLEMRDGNDQTALAYAVRRGHERICMILLHHGASLEHESVRKELKYIPSAQREDVKQQIFRWRFGMVLALREVMEMMLGVGDDTVYKEILDFTIISEESIDLV